MLATAVAALAVRGWPLRVLAGLLAAASLAVGYLGDQPVGASRTWRCAAPIWRMSR